MAAHQPPLSLCFSRQEYWNGLPFPSRKHACILCCFIHVRLCATLWTATLQAPLSTGFSRQEHWSWLSFPSLGEDSRESLRQEGDPTSPYQSWIFIGRTDAEAETLILWPPDEKNWLIWKDLNAGNDCMQEEKGSTQYEMVRWHHQLNEHEFE